MNANGDLTVDLRIEYCGRRPGEDRERVAVQFTDDPLVQESVRFLMTCEISHSRMFSAALADIQPNFPPGILQGDPRFTHAYYNMSDSVSVRGPWNQGQGPWPDGEQWVHIEDPHRHVIETRGQLDRKNVAKTTKANSSGWRDAGETAQHKVEDRRASRRIAVDEVPDARPSTAGESAEVAGNYEHATTGARRVLARAPFLSSIASTAGNKSKGLRVYSRDWDHQPWVFATSSRNNSSTSFTGPNRVTASLPGASPCRTWRSRTARS